MTQSVDLVEAVVKYPARNPIDTQYGERINVVVTTPEGEQIKLWGKPGEEIANLKKGQKVVLARDVKGYKLAKISPTTSPENSSKKPWTDDQKRDLATKAKDHAALLGYCLKLAKTELSEYCQNSEDLRTLGITIYLSALKN